MTAEEFEQMLITDKLEIKRLKAENQQLKDMLEQKPKQKCPVCDGKQVVPNWFYNPYGQSVTSSLTPEKCRTCNGLGVITW